jgi:hypothetical protein
VKERIKVYLATEGNVEAAHLKELIKVYLDTEGHVEAAPVKELIKIYLATEGHVEAAHGGHQARHDEGQDESLFE